MILSVAWLVTNAVAGLWFPVLLLQEGIPFAVLLLLPSFCLLWSATLAFPNKGSSETGTPSVQQC